MILRIDRRLGLGTVTFETKRVPFRAQQLRMITSVRVMASCASLLECWLMQHFFAVEFGLIGVASQTDIDGVRLQKTRRRAGVRTVTIRAVSGCSRMLEGCGLNLFRLVCVASNAHFFDLSFHENHLAVLGRYVAGLTLLLRERIVRELLQQLRTVGLVRIVAFEAIGFAERLSVVGLDQPFVLRVVAIETERRGCLGEVKLPRRIFPIFVTEVAAIASEIEGRVAAAAFSNFQAGIVARQAEILFFLSGHRLY